VDGASGHGLAGTALTENQNGGASVRDAFDQLEHPQHLVVFADDAGETVTLSELSFQLLIFVDDGSLTDGSFDGEPQFFINDRLGQLVEGAHANGFDSAFDGAESGEQNDGGFRGIFPSPLQQRKSVFVGQINVADNDFERKLFHPFNGFAACGSRFCAMTETSQIVGHSRLNIAIIIHNQQ